VTPATSLVEAVAAQQAAVGRLREVEQRQSRVSGIVGSLEGLLQEDRFSVRLARLLEIKDDRR
jgi:hypothetical protein